MLRKCVEKMCKTECLCSRIVMWNEIRSVRRYQNSEYRSYEVTLKTGCRGYGMSGVMGSVGAYNVGARMRPQLIGCALAQEPGVLNFGLRVANNGGRRICGDRKVI